MIILNDIKGILDFGTEIVRLWMKARIHFTDVLLLSLFAFYSNVLLFIEKYFFDVFVKKCHLRIKIERI